ncbi:MAG: hypothetical protein KAS32_03695 [Candidatus Peribacteraceae bacterium]|nr:hypothetical protein [Candidatus Peribacteraceae bacterium]
MGSNGTVEVKCSDVEKRCKLIKEYITLKRKDIFNENIQKHIKNQALTTTKWFGWVQKPGRVVSRSEAEDFVNKLRCEDGWRMHPNHVGWAGGTMTTIDHLLLMCELSFTPSLHLDTDSIKMLSEWGRKSEKYRKDHEADI